MHYNVTVDALNISLWAKNSQVENAMLKSAFWVISWTWQGWLQHECQVVVNSMQQVGHARRRVNSPSLVRECVHLVTCVWSLPITWQRRRSRHSIRRSRKPCATRKLHGSMFYKSGVMADEVLHCGDTHFRHFCSVTLTLTWWPSYTNLTRIPCRYIRCANINFLRQGFRMLSSDRHTERQTRPKVYTTSLRE